MRAVEHQLPHQYRVGWERLVDREVSLGPASDKAKTEMSVWLKNDPRRRDEKNGRGYDAETLMEIPLEWLSGDGTNTAPPWLGAAGFRFRIERLRTKSLCKYTAIFLASSQYPLRDPPVSLLSLAVCRYSTSLP